MSTSGVMKTLAFHQSAQGKSGRMPELSVKSVPVRQQKVLELPRVIGVDFRAVVTVKGI